MVARVQRSSPQLDADQFQSIVAAFRATGVPDNKMASAIVGLTARECARKFGRYSTVQAIDDARHDLMFGPGSKEGDF